jgi:2-dehydro-3-deoxyphosphogalactonate aldolase
MEIVEIKPILVGNTPPYRGGRCWFFVKLITDEGIEGIGEWSVGQIGREESQIRLIEDLGKLFVIGSDPFRIEDLWQRIYATSHDYRHPGLTSTPALSAIEMACWDIVGKTLKQPIYNLLGGVYHEKLRAYSYMRAYSDIPNLSSLTPPERAGKIAADMLEHGFTAMKFDPFTPLFPGPRDFTLKTINSVAKIFDAVGDEVEIGLGTHGQFNTYSAIRVAKILEKYNPFWFEEPVPPENVDEMARVAAHTSIPIAAGERLITKYEFAEVLKKQAAQILQLDVGHCGGIMESKKIAGMAEAEAHYAAIAPHMYCGPVAAAAAIQLDTCSPNFLIQEFNFGDLHMDILKKPFKFEKGYIIPPTDPGLGVELNEDVVAAHPYKPS